MKFKDLLNYGNSVYQIGEKINSLTRKNSNSKIKASTGAKLLMTGLICQNRSINEIIETTYASKNFKNIYKPREIKAKTHGLRDCIIDTDYKQYEKINEDILKTIKENKFFRKNLIDGLSVVAVDGVEEFETNKNIKKLPERKHRDERISRYYKVLGIMSIGEKSQILLKLEELKEKEGNEIAKKIEEENKDKKISEETITKKIKAEGEMTVVKRIVPEIKSMTGNRCDVVVLDALFDKAPVLNAIKKEGLEAVTRMKDERRIIYKDAMGLFENREADIEYEEVEIEEKIETKYKKESHKRDKIRTKVKETTREVTGKEIGKKVVVGYKETSQGKTRRKVTTTEKIKKRVKAWSDTFEMENYEYRKSKICKV